MCKNDFYKIYHFLLKIIKHSNWDKIKWKINFRFKKYFFFQKTELSDTEKEFCLTKKKTRFLLHLLNDVQKFI